MGETPGQHLRSPSSQLWPLNFSTLEGGDNSQVSDSCLHPKREPGAGKWEAEGMCSVLSQDTFNS